VNVVSNSSVVVINNGPSTANAIGVSLRAFTLGGGGGVRIERLSSPGWSCPGVAVGVFACGRQSIAPGATPGFTIRVCDARFANECRFRPHQLVADVASATPDPNSGNNHWPR
jgi:hypothetical protein